MKSVICGMLGPWECVKDVKGLLGPLLYFTC